MPTHTPTPAQAPTAAMQPDTNTADDAMEFASAEPEQAQPQAQHQPSLLYPADGSNESTESSSRSPSAEQQPAGRTRTPVIRRTGHVLDLYGLSNDEVAFVRGFMPALQARMAVLLRAMKDGEHWVLPPAQACTNCRDNAWPCVVKIRRRSDHFTCVVCGKGKCSHKDLRFVEITQPIVDVDHRRKLLYRTLGEGSVIPTPPANGAVLALWSANPFGYVPGRAGAHPQDWDAARRSRDRSAAARPTWRTRSASPEREGRTRHYSDHREHTSTRGEAVGRQYLTRREYPGYHSDAGHRQQARAPAAHGRPGVGVARPNVRGDDVVRHDRLPSLAELGIDRVGLRAPGASYGPLEAFHHAVRRAALLGPQPDGRYLLPNPADLPPSRGYALPHVHHQPGPSRLPEPRAALNSGPGESYAAAQLRSTQQFQDVRHQYPSRYAEADFHRGHAVAGPSRAPATAPRAGISHAGSSQASVTPTRPGVTTLPRRSDADRADNRGGDQPRYRLQHAQAPLVPLPRGGYVSTSDAQQARRDDVRSDK